MAKGQFSDGVSLSFVDLMACAFLGLIILIVAAVASIGTGEAAVPVVIATVQLAYPEPTLPLGDQSIRLNGEPVMLIEGGKKAFALRRKVRDLLEPDAGNRPTPLDLQFAAHDSRPAISLTSKPPATPTQPWEWQVIVMFKNDDIVPIRLEWTLDGPPANRPRSIDVTWTGADGILRHGTPVVIPEELTEPRFALLMGTSVQVLSDVAPER